MSRLRIAHVVHHLVIGGMENGVINLINRLPRDRFEHAVLCIEDASDFRLRIEDPRVPVRQFHRSQIGSQRLRWQLWQWMRDWRPDVVHTRNLSGLDALVPAWLAGAKRVHSEHGFDVADLQGLARKPRWLRRLHQPLMQRRIAVSRDLAQRMVEQWGAPRGRVEQIYNGVDTQRFRPGGAERRAAYPEWFRAPKRLLIGTVGRMSVVKDQVSLVRALGRLSRSHPTHAADLGLVLVGDGPLRSVLTDAVAQEGLAARCWFAGARDDVASLLPGLDVFVLPSLNEGISNTLLEAMACGVAVLASRVGGNPEVMPDDGLGLFEAGDVEALAGLLEPWLKSTAAAHQRGAELRAHVLAKFSLQAMMSRYQAVYESF